MRNIWRSFCLCLFVAFSAAAVAAGHGDHHHHHADKAAKPAPEAKKSVTHHSVEINGSTIRYTATAATMILKNDKGQPTGSLGYFAYTREGVDDLSRRPVTFVYNGGPGSASIWLHMGAFGPRRVVVPDAKASAPAPYKLVNNQYSLLDKTDLVFIDPIGTGLSRVVGKGKGKNFWGVDGDVKSLDQFVRRYISDNNRWMSPKFLLGESYGTTRSAALVNYLQFHDSIKMNGVVLVSSILNFNTASFNAGNDLPYIMFLPSYAATAWYHHLLPNQPKDLEPFLKQVEQFATGEYADALMAGGTLSDARRADVLEKLHRYTGLSKDYWAKANLRVNNGQFEKQLQRKSGKTTGRLDSRYSGPSFDLLSESAHYDPLNRGSSGPFTAAFNHYLHNDLKFGRGERYRVSAGSAIDHWNWKHESHRRNGGQAWPGALNVATDLAQAMAYNPYLKVMVNSGYYDLGTPFYATTYTFEHLGDANNIHMDFSKNLDMKYYQSGHMIYLHVPSLKQLKHNIAAFYDSTLSAQKQK